MIDTIALKPGGIDDQYDRRDSADREGQPNVNVGPWIGILRPPQTYADTQEGSYCQTHATDIKLTNFGPGTQMLKFSSRWLIEECEHRGIEEKDRRGEVEEVPKSFRVGPRHSPSNVEGGHSCQGDRALKSGLSVWAVLSRQDL